VQGGQDSREKNIRWSTGGNSTDTRAEQEWPTKKASLRREGRERRYGGDLATTPEVGSRERLRILGEPQNFPETPVKRDSDPGRRWFGNQAPHGQAAKGKKRNRTRGLEGIELFLSHKLRTKRERCPLREPGGYDRTSAASETNSKGRGRCIVKSKGQDIYEKVARDAKADLPTEGTDHETPKGKIGLSPEGRLGKL